MCKQYSTIFILLSLFLSACTKITYVPTYKKSLPVKIERDIARPIMLITEKESQEMKAKAIVQSYSICETRVSYLESIIKKVNNEKP